MSGDVLLITLFAAALAGLAFLALLGLRRANDRRTAPPLTDSETVSLAEAARIAYRQSMAEHLVVAKSAEYRASPAGAIAWFERSIREVVPASEGSDAAKVSRAEITRYMRWARTVQ